MGIYVSENEKQEHKEKYCKDCNMCPHGMQVGKELPGLKASNKIEE